MRRTLAILALCGLLTPSLASAQTAPTVVGYRTPAGAAQAAAAATPLPVTGTVTASEDHGAGATTATTLRTVTATDSPDVTALGTLDNVVGATSAATPTSAVLMGATDSVSGNLMPLRIYDADTGAGNDYRLGIVPLLPGAGGGTPASAGAGTVGAGVQRVTLGSDDPAVVSLGALDDAVATSGGVPATKGLQIIALDTGGNARALLANTGGAMRADISHIGANAIGVGVGDNVSGTLQVVDAGRPNAAEPACTTATAGDAGDAHVIAARAGRRLVWVQIQGDADGQLRVARATTTGATCTTTTGVGTLLDAGTATTAGGYWEDSVGYSGAVAICVPTAGATVSYCYGEVY